MISVSWGDRSRSEAAVSVVQPRGRRNGRACFALTLGELLELFKLTRIKYLSLYLDLVVLDKPLFELLPRRQPLCGGRGAHCVEVGENLNGGHVL
jgi:hypothetical protein